jgi:hypothetical protein
MLVNPNTPDTEAERRAVQAAARAIGQQLIVLDASSDRDIETAFATFVRRGAAALLVGAGAFFNSPRDHVLPDDGAIEDIEGSKQPGGAVAFVVMRHCAGAARFHRQARLGAVERLDLALFVDREDTA